MSAAKTILLLATAAAGLAWMAGGRRDEDAGPGEVLGGTLPWPVSRAKVQRVGQSVMADRNGAGRPHQGLDIFVPAGTEVTAVCSGRIVRVIDGRNSTEPKKRAAGLWIDLAGDDGRLYRYLHLGSAAVVKFNDRVTLGQTLGTVAPPHTSGLAADPHLHFEVREDPKIAYGTPLDPRRYLAA